MSRERFLSMLDFVYAHAPEAEKHQKALLDWFDAKQLQVITREEFEQIVHDVTQLLFMQLKQYIGHTSNPDVASTETECLIERRH